MQQAYIINGVRTAIGNFGGTLSTVRTDDLAAFVLKELMKKNPTVNFSSVGDVILGCANQAGEDNRNVARMSALLAGLPVMVPGQTVNRLCASGLSASIDAARAIQVGDEELMISGGVENMTRGPLVMSKASSAFGRDQQLFDSSFGWRFINPKMKELFGVDAMGETAENVAELHNNQSRRSRQIDAVLREQGVARYSAFQILRMIIERSDQLRLYPRGSKRDALRSARWVFSRLARLYADGASPQLRL